MHTVQSLRSNAALVLLALAIGGLIGGSVTAWQMHEAPDTRSDPAASTASSDTAATGSTSGLAAYDEDGDGLVYQGGMHPDVVQDAPGDCPVCGMQLTPVHVGETTEDGTVRISPATLQNIGVQTATVPVEPLSRRVRTTGRFEANTQLMTAVSPKVSGWVDRLYVEYDGARVRKGEPLFEVYSPELVATQEEYLTALRNARRLGAEDRGSQRLVEAARRRLAYWDITDRQIERLKESGTPQRTLSFYAPSSGTVTRMAVTEGEKISAGQTLMHITRLHPLWLMVDVYEQDLAWVDVGTEAQIQLPYAPGTTIEGQVDYIYDEVDAGTRTATARISVPNPTRRLKPGMYATVTLTGGRAEARPLVPQEAVVSSGAREVVIQALGGGRFRPVPVQTGLTAGGQTQILRGLDGGEEVVTSAQFLIDSEARLQGALGAMASGHQHGSDSANGASTNMDREMDSTEVPATSMDSHAGDAQTSDAAHDHTHDHSSHAAMADSLQTIGVTIGPGGFSPQRIELETGVPARLVFTRTTESTCATKVQIPAFGVEPTHIPMNEPTAIPFTPENTGSFTFACGMNMITGTLLVVES
jgi:RND family efflux transporter MFP subunit